MATQRVRTDQTSAAVARALTELLTAIALSCIVGCGGGAGSSVSVRNSVVTGDVRQTTVGGNLDCSENTASIELEELSVTGSANDQCSGA